MAAPPVVAELVEKFETHREADHEARFNEAQLRRAFLGEIESWRDALARNLALRNPGISPRDLNFAVQRTIDRIVFLRICEDRGIEPYGQLQGLLNGQNVYARLGELFHRADDRYNSGLFYFTPEKGRRDPPDALTLGLTIDDKTLKDLLRGLYYPESPYEFSVLPAEILGQVYEQFLGKVIRLTKGGQARVEEKPEVKKAGGVYYTPSYIVDYIVRHTVGKLVEGRSPKQVERLAVLDPACGSGSFLIGAYQFLLDWHRDWYQSDGPEKHARGKTPRVFRDAHGQWLLAASERKRILLANIYGVDIDSQAVEVTKLSLLLKVLEGQSKESIEGQLRFLHERALPDLSGNIKCGNSLIGPDFYADRQKNLFDEEEIYRINAFDWQAEFPEVFRGKERGFDAVIGNPPYLFITEVPESIRGYYQDRYHGVSYRFDLYGAFLEAAATRWPRPGGLLGFILPHTLLSNDSFRGLRRLLAVHTSILEVVDLGPGVFANAKNETMLLFLASSPSSSAGKVAVVRTNPKVFPEYIERFAVSQRGWASDDGTPWLVHLRPDRAAIIRRMTATPQTLGEFCTANQGLRTGDNDKYLAGKPRGKAWKRAAGGKQVARYGPLGDGLFVLYRPELLDAPRRPEIFESAEKIVVQEIRNISLPRRIIATLDERQTYCLQSTNVVNARSSCKLNLRYVLGILNSGPVNFFFRCCFPGNNHIPSNQLLRIPIPLPPDRARHDRMVELVAAMLKLHERLSAVRTEQEKTVLARQVNATDRQIDQLVYELYGLSDKGIALVEEATA